MPPVTANPNAWLSWSTCRHRQPPWARTVPASGSTPYASHRGEIDHQAVVTHRVPGHGMCPAPDRDRQVPLASQTHRSKHVSGPGTAGDEGGPTLDLPIPDLPSRSARRPLPKGLPKTLGSPSHFPPSDMSSSLNRVVGARQGEVQRLNLDLDAGSRCHGVAEVPAHETDATSAERERGFLTRLARSPVIAGRRPSQSRPSASGRKLQGRLRRRSSLHPRRGTSRRSRRRSISSQLRLPPRDSAG